MSDKPPFSNTVEPMPLTIKELESSLNPSQREAVKYISGPELIIAGPGSGKTKALTSKICYLILKEKLSISDILAVTFTNKAAEEMRERVSSMMGFDVKNNWITTFHSACLKILRIYHVKADLPKNFSILDSDASRSIVSIVLKDLGFKAEPDDIRDYLKMISKIKNMGISGKALSKNALYKEKNNREIYDNYCNKLSQIAALDFDDILLKTLQLLENDESTRLILQNKFKYILVDEFQDTNMIQNKIIKLLLNAKARICVVGDRDQSIYAFRGSSPELIENFESDYPGCKVYYLNENYRSTPEILEVCSSIIKVNPAKYRNDLTTSNESGERVRLVGCYDDKIEAKFIVEEIKKSNMESAILLRTNSQSRVFEEELSNSGIPYQLIGAHKFYDRMEIRDTLSYIKLATNPKDEIAFNRSINIPRRGLGAVALTKVKEYAAEYTDYDLVESINELSYNGDAAGKQKAGFENYSLTIASLRSEISKGPEFAVDYLLRGLGLITHYQSDKSEGPDRILNIGQLYEGALTFSNNYREEKGLDIAGEEITTAWLEHISLISGVDVVEGNIAKSKAFVMTAHSSKGREFDNVYVAGIEQGLFPFVKYGEEINEEEERRLLFVATSRAKQKLTLSYAERRYLYGRSTDQRPSIFLKNLPDTVIRVKKVGEMKGKIYQEELRKATDNPSNPIHLIQSKRITTAEAIVGAKVEHPMFGKGKIEQVLKDNIVIKFKDGSERQFKTELTPLIIIS